MTIEVIGRDHSAGVQIGAATSAKVAFFGGTPITQPTAYSFATSAVGTASSADVTTGQKAGLIACMNTFSQLNIWPAQA